MKKKFWKIGAVVIAATAISSVFSATMISHSSGSDPLITLSYLTEIILPQFKTDVISEVDKKLNGTYTDADTGNTAVNTGTSENTQTDAGSTVTPESSVQPSAVSNTYTLLELTYGQCVYATSVLEIIVGPGSEVLAISPFENQGIADITGTKEYLNGELLGINSYCIIPRGNDGRGLYVNNEKSYILVRGEYYIG